MISKLFLFYSLTFNVINYSSSECTVGDHTFPNGEIWLQNTYFNVTCRRGKISVMFCFSLLSTDLFFQVLNCVTDRGTFLPVGTPPFIEEGIKYTCDPVDEPIEFLPDDFEGSGEEEISGECEDGKTEYNFAGFVVSCLTNQILGCVDSSGEIVTNGFFYLPNKVLKYCRVFGNNKKARIENKGSFKSYQGNLTNSPTSRLLQRFNPRPSIR